MNAIEFLRAFHPEGPWILTAIQVDRRGIETTTFASDQVDAARKWVDDQNGKRNLYFSVSLASRALSKKANREDIDLVPWLHVDIDARAGEALAPELERIRSLLVDRCPVPPPTFVVFSGGGYQAFWRLKVPVRENVGEVARYNKQLEIVLGGDNCSNVDRIMRLPGTLNIPNARKVEKGRTPTIAEVYSYDASRSYDLSEFTPVPGFQVEGLNATPVAPPSNVARLDNVDDLDEWKVPDRVKVVIVQGYHPDEPKDGDNSRSAWLFDACCQLVRAKVPDEKIFAIITDPSYGISSSVLDKKPKDAEYAMRQTARVKEEVEEPWLRKMNEKFAVIGNLGGKCRVIEEVFDATMKRTKLTKQTFDDFKNRYASAYVDLGNGKRAPVGRWWLGHPLRRQFESIVFSPGREEPESYNLWRGFSVRSIPSEKHEPFLAHLRDNICAGNGKYFDYLIGWMARAVQKPDSIGETAVVLRGKSGTGKSFFAKHFGSIWGRHFLQVSDAKHLVGSFNAHLRDCVVLFGDEAFFAGDKKHESVLKTLITEETMVVEHKGVDAEVSPNFIHLILASNSDWVVPTGATERRFFVLDVSDEHQQDNAYFKAIALAMGEGGREALLHFLLTYDLAGFDVRRVPLTRALMEQKIHSLSPMHEWWYDRLLEGALVRNQGWSAKVACDDLVSDYVQSCIQYNVPRRGSSVKLGMFLQRVCPRDWPKRERSGVGSTRRYYYLFPTLKKIRDKWDELYAVPTPWPEEEEGKVDVAF